MKIFVALTLAVLVIVAAATVYSRHDPAKLSGQGALQSIGDEEIVQLLNQSERFLHKKTGAEAEPLSDAQSRLLVAALRHKYKFESIQPQLAVYKTPWPSLWSVPLSEEAIADLEQLESTVGWNPRRDNQDDRRLALKVLHEATVDEFIRQEGFGVYRVATMDGSIPEHILALNYLSQPIAQPTILKSEHTLSSESGSIDDFPTSPNVVGTDWKADKSSEPNGKHLIGFPHREALEYLHNSAYDDFVFERGWGFVRSPKEVAGFLPHRVSRVPELWMKVDHVMTNVNEAWSLSSLELIGLWKSSEPVVYVSKNLPQMEEIRTASTRKLTDFEAASVQRLTQGEQLVVNFEKGGIRMVGALRAHKDCMQCHSVQRGTVLGAFSYTLAPVQ